MAEKSPAHPPHLAQRPHRVGDVLQHLVCVHDVEGVVRVVQRVHVGHRERDVVQAALLGQVGGRRQRLGRGVDTGDPAGGDRGGQVGGDRSGSAAHIQQRVTGVQLVEQVGRRVRRGAPPVRAQHRLVMPMGVRGLPLRHHRTPLRPHHALCQPQARTVSTVTRPFISQELVPIF